MSSLLYSGIVSTPASSMSIEQSHVSRFSYAGLSCVAASMLMFEILLTRIFSVVLWYHMAFLAVSLSMFGLTLGALQIQLRPEKYPHDQSQTLRQLSENALMLGITMVVTFALFLMVPVDIIHSSWMTFLWLALIFVLFAIPYYFGGVTTGLIFSRLSPLVSRMYAVDLGGAALGCLLAPFLLIIVDAPSALILSAAIACIGALLFALDARAAAGNLPAATQSLLRNAGITAATLALIACLNGLLFNLYFAPIRLIWMKGQLNTLPMYERWNPFACIRVDRFGSSHPFGWGFSSKMPPDTKSEQLMLVIDDNAGTVLTRFNGDTKPVSYLKYDLTNAAHYLRPDSRVFIIGAGGGRDILSALVFNQKSVVAADINDITINRLLKDRYANFTGNLSSDPRITLVCDEARAHLSSMKEKFDIIEASLVDTWAATCAGAFSMSENSIYTLDAWKMFLTKLTDRGVVTISRWYPPGSPEGSYKACALAVKALRESGISDPRKHIIMMFNRDRYSVQPIFNLMMSKSPFTDADIALINRLCDEMGFKVLLSPVYSSDPMYERLTGTDYNNAVATYASDIEPPDDNRPFFFNTVRLRDFFSPQTFQRDSAVRVIDSLLLAVSLLIATCIFLPMRTTSESLKKASTLPVYFLSIGLGYLLIEIAQVERLSIYLGHPTLGISVVLFSMLLFSGLGSLSTGRLALAQVAQRGPIIVGTCILVLALTFTVAPHVMQYTADMSTVARSLVAAAILAPMAFVMGTAFPIGIKIAWQISPEASAWLWALNGAASVTASVVAIALSLTLGIQFTAWCGIACYVAATASLLFCRRPQPDTIPCLSPD